MVPRAIAAPLLTLGLWVGPARHLTAQAPAYRDSAVRILRTVPLIDGHNDIPDAIREHGGLDSVNFAVPR